MRQSSLREHSILGLLLTVLAVADPTLQVTPDRYGSGIGSDQYGRPVVQQPVTAPADAPPDPTLKVTPDRYGPGLGADQYGRPVEVRPYPPSIATPPP